MSELAFNPNTGKPLKEQWPAEAHEGVAAYAAGLKSYDTPYSAHRQPDQFAAWRDGWEFADREARGEEDDDGDYC